MTDQTNLPADVAAPSPPAIAKAGMSPGGAIAALVPQSLDDAFRLAKALSASGDMVPKHFQGKPEATMAAIVRGMEVGLAPMQALANIAVINGRASIWGDAIPALLQRAGHMIDCEISGDGDARHAAATLTRVDGRKITRTFSVADAKKAGLWGKAGPWQQYPDRMLSNRARAFAARDGAADALMGLQVAEEVSDYAMKDVTPDRPQSRLQQMVAQARGVEAPVSEPAPVEEAEVMDAAPGHWTDVAPADFFPGSEIFNEGAQDFQNGHAATTCPYDEGSPEAADWLAGWYGARRAAE